MDFRKKRTIVINFIGSPGSGKTLLAALTFSELKMRGKVCEYVQKFAKSLVWTKKFSQLNNQYYVSNHQNELLSSIVQTGKVDFIITDGPLLNGLYYNRYNPDNVSDVDKTERFILDRYKEYDNFNVYLRRDSFPYEQVERIATVEQAKEVDRILYSMLQKYDIPVFEIKSSPESVKTIVDTILYPHGRPTQMNPDPVQPTQLPTQSTQLPTQSTQLPTQSTQSLSQSTQPSSHISIPVPPPPTADKLSIKSPEPVRKDVLGSTNQDGEYEQKQEPVVSLKFHHVATNEHSNVNPDPGPMFNWPMRK